MAPPEAREPDGARGVFETLLILKGRPVFFDEHAERFADGCARFRLEGAPGTGDLRAAAANAIAGAGLNHGVLRWSAWDSSWSIAAAPPRPHMMKAVWTAKLAAARLPGPDSESACKHLGRAIWLQATAAAREAGADEAILADGAGRVVEGGVSNVFCVFGGRLATPALGCGPLPGIVRAKVLALAREGGIPAAEEIIGLDALRRADEIFLTNSLVGIRPLAGLEDGRRPAPGPLTARLQAEWRRRHGW